MNAKPQIKSPAASDSPSAAWGILKHHFWGHYVADIFLCFNDPAAVPAAIEKLKLKNPEASYRGVLGAPLKTKWIISEEEPRAVMISAEGDTLEEIQNLLESFGADKKKMNSMAKSIDRGERFEIEIPA